MYRHLQSSNIEANEKEIFGTRPRDVCFQFANLSNLLKKIPGKPSDHGQ